MRWGILAFMFSLFVFNYADKSLVGYAAIAMMEEFHLTPVQWGLVGSSFFWLFPIMNVFGGALSDRFGPKILLALMALSWTVIQFGGYGIMGLTSIIILRVLLGFFEGPFYPTAVSQISNWFKPESRGMALSILSAGGPIGALVSAPILVYLIQNHGWRNAYGFLGLLTLIWFFLWIWLGKERPSIEQDTDVLSQNRSNKKLKWSEIYPIILSPTFIFTAIATFAFYWFNTWVTVWMPIYLVKIIHLTPMKMGFIAAMIGICAPIITILIASYSDRLLKRYQNYRKARVFVAAGSIVLTGLICFYMAASQNSIWIIISLVAAKGLASTVLPLGTQIVNKLSPEIGSTLTGSLVGFATIAGSLGPIVSGYVMSYAGNDIALGHQYTLLLNGALLVIGGIVLLAFAQPDKSIQKVNQKEKLQQVN